MPLFLGCGAELRPQKVLRPPPACAFPFNPVTRGFGKAQRALYWESNERHYGAKCCEMEWEKWSHSQPGGSPGSGPSGWPLNLWPCRLVPGALGIDTDAKQGPEQLRNNSGISKGKKVSGFGKEPEKGSVLFENSWHCIVVKLFFPYPKSKFWGL